MILPIHTIGDDILREECRNVTEDDFKRGYPFDVNTLISDMFDTVRVSGGCGLSACQIGRDLRLFVIDADSLSDLYPECSGFSMVFINPVIIGSSYEKTKDVESCLSLPKKCFLIERYESIRLEYYDENMEKHDEEFGGFIARIIQHECDHLDGKLLCDYEN